MQRRNSLLFEAPPAFLERRFEAPGEAVGIECEYGVYEDGRHVDFRKLINELIPFADVVPDLRNPSGFYRKDGTKFSADGWYAELAMAPEPVRAGVAARIADQEARQRAWLLELLAEHSRRTSRCYTLKGYSTHFNIGLPTALDCGGLAKKFALSYGPLMLFMINHPRSRGVLFRPRPGRFEIAGEFVEDPDRLKAQVTLFVGAFQAALDRTVQCDFSDLPLLPESALVPTTIRYGWRLTPEALGRDVRRVNRKALITTTGDVSQLQDVLEKLWASIKSRLNELDFSSREITAAEDYILEKKFGGLETPRSLHERTLTARSEQRRVSAGSRLFAEALRTRRFGLWQLSPAFVHWDFIVYNARRNGAQAYLNLPRHCLADFSRKTLDACVAKLLADFVSGAESDGTKPRRLSSSSQTAQPGVFFEINERALARSLEQIPHCKKKKKKKKRGRKESACGVEVDKEGNIDIFIPETTDPQRAIGPQEPPRNAGHVADGVWVHNGAFANEIIDHEVNSLGFNFAFVRCYRSSVEYSGILGSNWDHKYNIRVVPERPPTARPTKGGWSEHFDPSLRSGGLKFHHGTGRVTRHEFVSWEIREIRWCDALMTAVVSTYQQNDGEDFEIQRYVILSGSPPAPLRDPIFYRIRFRDGTRYLLNCHGYVEQIRDRNFNAMQFSYGLPFNPSTGYFVLRSARDTLGRSYSFEYRVIDGVPRIRRVTDFKGRSVDIQYDGDVQINKVETVRGDAGRPKWLYQYNGGQRPGLLTRITAPVEASQNGAHYLENHYDAAERVDRQRVGDGASSGGTFQINYHSDSVVVTDRSGTAWTHKLRDLGGTKVVREISVEDEVYQNGAYQAQKKLSTKYDHDRHFHVIEIAHPDRRVETFRFRNLNGRITAGSERDDVTANITYHNDLGRDNLLQQRTVPTPGAPGKAAPFTTRYDFEYLFNGVTKIVSPLGTTTFVYENGICGSPEKNGNSVEVTFPSQRNPDGSVFPVKEFYSYGRGGTRVRYLDPDGIEHVFGLDTAGRIASHSVGGQTLATYQYNDVGLVTSRTDERGKKFSYSYDDRDNLRKSIDPMKHVDEATYDLNDRLRTHVVELFDDPTALPNLVPADKMRITSTVEYDILGRRLRLNQSSRRVGSGTQPGLRRSWRWEYDGEGRNTLEETPNHATHPDAKTRRRYNRRGLVSEVIEGEGGANAGSTRSAYDSVGRLTYVSDPSQKRKTWRYDGHGRPVIETQPDGSYIGREYKGPHLLREQVIGAIDLGTLGRRSGLVLRNTNFVFDHAGRVTQRTEKVFDVVRWTGMKASAPYDAVWKTCYTAAGRLQKEVDPAGRATSCVYDTQGRLFERALPGGHVTTYAYEGALVAGSSTRLVPDPGTTEQPPPNTLLLWESITYDDCGRPTRKRFSNGVVNQYAHDSLGNLRVEEGALGRKTFEYDGFCRLSARTINNLSIPGSSREITQRFGYDANDNITSLSDGAGRVTSSRFNGRNWPEFLQRPGQPDLTLRYRADGLVLQAREGGRRVDYQYTSLGQVQSVTFREGATVVTQNYGYDSLGRPGWGEETSSAPGQTSGVTTYRIHDSLGRLRAELTRIPQFSFSAFSEKLYLANHLEERLILPGSNADILYRYGMDGNLKEIREATHGLSSPLIGRLHQGPGRILETENRISLLVGTGATQQLYNLGLRIGQRYDADGRPSRRNMRITDELNRPGQSPLNLLPIGIPVEQTEYIDHGMMDRRLVDNLRVDYVYDGNEQLKTMLEQEGADYRFTDFSWDTANRPKQFATTTVQGGQTIQTSVDSSYTAAQRMDSKPGAATLWQFDSFGRVERMRDPAAGATRIFHYDGRDRLRRLTSFQAGVITLSGRNSYFLYDAFGRVVARTNDTGQPGEIFLHHDRECHVEYDTNRVQQRRYVYDENGRVVRYLYRDAASGGTVDVFPVSNCDGSPWLLIVRDISMNQLVGLPGAGAVALARSEFYQQRVPLVLEEHRWRPFEPDPITQYTYYYGSPRTSQPVTQSILPLSTGGERFFSEDRLSGFGERFYDDQLRGFIVPDRLGAWADPHSLGNPYVYASNNPIMYTDDGHIALPLITGAIGAVIGAGIGFYKTGTLGGTLAGALAGAAIGSGAALLAGAAGLTSVGIAGVTVPAVSFGTAAAVTGAGLGAAYFGRRGFRPGGYNSYQDWADFTRGAVYGAVAGYALGAGIQNGASGYRLGGWWGLFRGSGLQSAFISAGVSAATYSIYTVAGGRPLTAGGVLRAGAVGFVGGFAFAHLLTGATYVLRAHVLPGLSARVVEIGFKILERHHNVLHPTATWLGAAGFGYSSGITQFSAETRHAVGLVGGGTVSATGGIQTGALARGVACNSVFFKGLGHVQAFGFGLLGGAYMTPYVSGFLEELGF